MASPFQAKPSQAKQEVPEPPSRIGLAPSAVQFPLLFHLFLPFLQPPLSLKGEASNITFAVFSSLPFPFPFFSHPRNQLIKTSHSLGETRGEPLSFTLLLKGGSPETNHYIPIKSRTPPSRASSISFLLSITTSSSTRAAGSSLDFHFHSRYFDKFGLGCPRATSVQIFLHPAAA